MPAWAGPARQKSTPLQREPAARAKRLECPRACACPRLPREARYASEQVRCQLRKLAALSLAKHDVPRDALLLEALGNDAQPVGRVIDIRVVDLMRVARQDDLRRLAASGDDRFDFVRREVLCLIDDEI